MQQNNILQNKYFVDTYLKQSHLTFIDLSACFSKTCYHKNFWKPTLNDTSTVTTKKICIAELLEQFMYRFKKLWH